jgi:hypothetical protein
VRSRSRGAGLYISRINVTSAADYNGPGLWLGDGWVSTPISPSPVVQAALKACTHVLGLHGGNPTATSAQLRTTSPQFQSATEACNASP